MSLPRKRNAGRGWIFALLRFYRWLRWQAIRLRPDLSPRETAALAITHLIVRPFEELTHRWVRRRYGEMPREFKPHWGRHRATIIIGVGLGQKSAHAYWLARHLSRYWRCRVLVLRTPPQGNVDSTGGYNLFRRIALMNLGWIQWAIASDAGLIPIIGLGFSKGGQDITVLAHHLLNEWGLTLDVIMTLSTPWQGSRLWKRSTLAGAEHFEQGSRHLYAVEMLGHTLRNRANVVYRFFCASALDMIVHRSDARFRRPRRDKRISRNALRTRWYYARPLWLQFGHTALFNPLVYVQMGLEIRRLVRFFQLRQLVKQEE